METTITACSVCHGDSEGKVTCTSCSNIEAENKEYADACNVGVEEAERKADRDIK